MNFDKPPQAIWVAQLTATGLASEKFIKIIDTPVNSNSIINLYEDEGKLNYDVQNYFESSEINYSIINNALDTNQTTFNWYFSSYKAPVYNDVAIVAVNYFNNYTTKEIEVLINSNADTIYPPFYLELDAPSPAGNVQKTYIVPAGSINFPLPVYINPNATGTTVTLSCELSLNPTKVLSNCIMKYNGYVPPVTPTNTPTNTATPTATPTPSVTPSVTVTNTPTVTVTPTPTLTVTPTATPTITPTPTLTVTPTPTPSPAACSNSKTFNYYIQALCNQTCIDNGITYKTVLSLSTSGFGNYTTDIPNISAPFNINCGSSQYIGSVTTCCDSGLYSVSFVVSGQASNCTFGTQGFDSTPDQYLCTKSSGNIVIFI